MKSESGLRFVEVNNLKALSRSREIVIRFSMKFYYPQKISKSYSTKKYNKNIAKFFEIRAHMIRNSKIFAVALTNML
jgi:hypothetical protein